MIYANLANPRFIRTNFIMSALRIAIIDVRFILITRAATKISFQQFSYIGGTEMLFIIQR